MFGRIDLKFTLTLFKLKFYHVYSSFAWLKCVCVCAHIYLCPKLLCRFEKYVNKSE